MLKIIIVLFFALSCGNSDIHRDAGISKSWVGMPADVDGGLAGDSVSVEQDSQVGRPSFPNDEQLRIIGRMANGIQLWKERWHRGWWECGVEYSTKEELESNAVRWAYRIVELAAEHSDDDLTLNPWGIAGVVANESGFDRCALGPWLRKWAYKKKALKKKNGTVISHNLQDLKAWLQRPRVIASHQQTGFDCGPMQELWKCDVFNMCRSVHWRQSMPSIPFDQLFTMGVHFDWQVRELRRRARRHKVSDPWLYWRGRRTKWYKAKVERWARQLGAREGEI